MSKRKEDPQENNIERWYPVEPYIHIYQGHKHKWGEILNTNSIDRVSKWNTPKDSKWSFHLNIEPVIEHLKKSLPYKRSPYSHVEFDKLVGMVIHDEKFRYELQELLFNSYVYLIENSPDCVSVKRYDKVLEKDVWVEEKFKEKLVSYVEIIDKSNNNPFDLVWYMGTHEYKKRNIVLSIIVFSVFIVLIVLFHYWGRNSDIVPYTT
jgi:hypothetical protein